VPSALPICELAPWSKRDFIAHALLLPLPLSLAIHHAPATPGQSWLAAAAAGLAAISWQWLRPAVGWPLVGGD